MIPATTSVGCRPSKIVLVIRLCLLFGLESKNNPSPEDPVRHYKEFPKRAHGDPVITEVVSLGIFDHLSHLSYPPGCL